MLYLTTFLLGVLIIIFFTIQVKTLIFEHHTKISLAGLVLITVISIISIIDGCRSDKTPIIWTIIGLHIVCALLFGTISIVKIQLGSKQLQPLRRLLRTPTDLDYEHEHFTVVTKDHVQIHGYLITGRTPNKAEERVVIIAHGGFRSKDLFIKALLATWLSENFDIINFDFRGHGDSGGEWTGDGLTVNDLNAIIRYAKEERGYKKIGVFGRSMGGWTAILEGVDNPDDINAIVVAGLPPGFFREVPELSRKIRFLRYRGAALLMRMVIGVRIKHYDDIRSPIKEVHKLAPVPLLIVYNQADPAAGVAGEEGYWESLPFEIKRKDRFKNISKLPYTAKEVYDAAGEPKKLHILPGAAHVYSLEGIRTLFLEVEKWFIEYL